MVQSLLSERQNRYLARQLCWVFTVEGIETFILRPRDPLDTESLVDSLRSVPRPTDVDVVIGLLGPIAPPELCNALMIPVVFVDQLYSFDVDSLIESIPRPKQIRQDQFKPAAEELFSRIIQLADNAGVTDADRALNYLAVRYPGIYHLTAERFAEDATLSDVAVRPSRLSGTRRIVNVIFSYTDRKTDVTDKQFVRVDVTEEFPFLVTKLSPYIDRAQ
jgi:PatG C-terminal